MPNNHAEIYRQRYETFRHLDKLRWQMLQITVAIGSIFTLILRITDGAPEWWFIGGLGLILVANGFAMLRINSGIKKNGSILQEFGKKIGDISIPSISPSWKASSHWLAILILSFGSASLLFSLTKFCQCIFGVSNA